MNSRFIFSFAAGLVFLIACSPLTIVAQEKQGEPDVAGDFEELAKSFEKFASSLEKKVEESAEEYGKEFESWAEQFGQEMETWAEENSGKWEAWAEEFSGEFEQWAKENAGQWEQMAKKLEHRLSELETKLRADFEDSGIREEVQNNFSDLANRIRKELDNTDPKDKSKVEQLRKKLFDVLAAQKKVKQRVEEQRKDRAEGKAAGSRNEYLEKRIDELRGALKGDLSKEKRAVLERALAQLTDLKAATGDQDPPATDHVHATQERLQQMMAAEERRHAEVMNKLRQETNRLRDRAQLMEEEQVKEPRARDVEIRELHEQAKAEGRNRAGKANEREELEKLREEVRRLKRELESIKK